MAVPASGEQHEISAGALRAVVTEVGGALRSFTDGDRDLVVPFDEASPRKHYRGSVLAPWPNRTGDGRWSWQGASQQLALTEPDRSCALHGLVCWQPWDLLERSADSVVLGTTVWPQAGYPGHLELRVSYRLVEEGPDAGLTWELEATGVGDAPAPYGTSIHPYVVAGPGRVDDWTFELSAAATLVVDPDRLLPVLDGDGREQLRPVDGTDLDFRGGAPLRGRSVDDAYAQLSGPQAGTARVLAADGTGVAVHWDPQDCPWVQVHTADRPEPEDDRVGLAVEPMTCPPDALRTGTDLRVLERGQSTRSWWRLEPLRAAGPSDAAVAAP